ncbi:gamma-glutamyl-gamma-aminobutyrate hydrolase family protein [Telmatospirillum sp. J64-1]|uniref:gamma-glutamyl-gamma-aminobutyrate hydrolase family protein n=1 Tax=Telmatospirillum sp. J64-1 TaxID=2502183 RepID=UPI002103B6CD|nr:gamma-glutamyl-gamma-aminobutyrate hydrolase family protein [Telmatospirillum sp. J64-1]
MGTAMTVTPLVGLSACIKPVVGEGLPFHATPEPYITAVAEGSGCLPVLLPALGAAMDPARILPRIDGLVLTGSKSNVDPALYGAGNLPPAPPYDAARDSTTLPLIRAAIAAGVPLLAICRGIQELNVALGGSLHPRLHQVPGRFDHRPKGDVPDERFALAHPVRLTPGGLLHRLAGTEEAMVNSVHGQGLDRLGEGLAVEAMAEDGTIEAVSVTGAPAFALGLQWHPEWRFAEDRLSTAIFRAFGEAVRQRALQKISC